MKSRKFLKRVVVASFLLLTSCDSYDPTAGFSGKWIKKMGDQQTQSEVVAYFANFEVPSKIEQSMDLRLYKVLGSSNAIPISINYNWFKKRILLHFKELSRDPILLKITEKNQEIKLTCGKGKEGANLVKLCYTPDKVDLTITNKEQHTKDEIHLTRGVNIDEPLNRTLTMDEAMGRGRFSSYQARQQAEKVYQSRQDIDIARAALEPKLNLRTVLSLGLTPVSGVTGFVVLDIIDNFFPFVYPTFWYRWHDAKYNFEAMKDSFRALQANQMRAVQFLYYTIQRDTELADRIERRMNEVKQTLDTTLRLYRTGFVDAELATKLEKKYIELENDEFQFRLTVGAELAEFSSALAFRQDTDKPLKLVPQIAFETEHVSALKPFPNDLAKEAEKWSFELRAMEDLKSSAKRRARAAKFAPFRPAAGILFDFSYIPSIMKELSTVREIQDRIDETRSKIKSNSLRVANTYQGFLGDFDTLSQNLERAKNDLARKIALKSSIEEIDDVHDRIYDLEMKLIRSHHDLMIAVSGYERITLTGVYASLRKNYLDLENPDVQQEGQDDEDAQASKEGCFGGGCLF